MKTKLILGLSLIFLMSCSDSDKSSTGGGAPVAATDAVYTVTFTSLWNATEHVSVPGNAHFSPLVLSIHNSSHRMFTIGELSSAGFESLAESGSTSSITGELDTDVSGGSVLRYSVEDDLFLNMGTTLTFEVAVSQNHPLVSMATMIAPSPDWVVGLDGLELYTASGGFVADTGDINLNAYNAGTEEGDTGGNYSIGNAATTPPQVMTSLSGVGFTGPFARIRFVKK